MPSNAKAKRDAFVQVPLWWAEQAAQATRTPQAMVWLWLLHLSWKEHSLTFKLPNARLSVRGVSRSAKSRASARSRDCRTRQVARVRMKVADGDSAVPVVTTCDSSSYRRPMRVRAGTYPNSSRYLPEFAHPVLLLFFSSPQHDTSPNSTGEVQLRRVALIRRRSGRTTMRRRIMRLSSAGSASVKRTGWPRRARCAPA